MSHDLRDDRCAEFSPADDHSDSRSSRSGHQLRSSEYWDARLVLPMVHSLRHRQAKYSPEQSKKRPQPILKTCDLTSTAVTRNHRSTSSNCFDEFRSSTTRSPMDHRNDQRMCFRSKPQNMPANPNLYYVSFCETPSENGSFPQSTGSGSRSKGVLEE